MEHVTSSDGTRIAFWRRGTGPPLLLVHGATADHATTWQLVLPALEERFTVCTMDRRGRGSSGDSAMYELAREADDVAAVVDALGKAVDLLGHSYGALCALEASLRTTGVRRLILYEGVPLRGQALYPPGLIARMEGMLERGEIEMALVTMLRDVAGLSVEGLDLMRAQTTAWERRLANTCSMPRELRTEASYVFDPARFRAMATPTLLLVGGASPTRELTHARGVAAALPDSRIVVLDGQEHAAMLTAPDLFVREVVHFLAT
jgi:pimeloyl-ACP methyl ester carboxylesterase